MERKRLTSEEHLKPLFREVAKLSPSTIEYWRGHLSIIRDHYSDEIPRHIIHFGPYKVRKGWWAALFINLDAMNRRGFIEEGLRDEVEEFITFYRESDFFNLDFLTSEQDIDYANNIVDRVLGREPQNSSL